MPDVKILVGDVRARLEEIPDESVHCVVTSPPYWGLRDYKTESQVWGGASECQHQWASEVLRSKGGKGQNKGLNNPPDSGVRQARDNDAQEVNIGTFCCKCGAWKGQLGLEPTIDLYVKHLTEIFREVRRVLRMDGTLWLNMGDCYSNDTKWGGSSGAKNKGSAAGGYHGQRVRPGKDCDPKRGAAAPGQPMKHASGLKPKDLVMQPSRVALALQTDGWWLRQEIVWAKGISFCESYAGSCMPESCRDRPTSSHEKLFLMTKASRYFYDQGAVREGGEALNQHDPTGCGYDAPGQTKQRGNRASGNKERKFGAAKTGNPSRNSHQGWSVPWSGNSRNLRSVWAINPQPFPEAHFATFPERLAEPCVKAGTSERGCCPDCGAPWRRIVDRHGATTGKAWHDHSDDTGAGQSQRKRNLSAIPYVLEAKGWELCCPHFELAETDWKAGRFTPCTVLDPFMGSGTVGLVALRLGRSALGIELNPAYAELARERIERDCGLLGTVILGDAG